MNNKIYFDNAATTPLSEGVRKAMIEAMDAFGNPSSTHGFGRKSRIIIEQVRKDIAKLLKVQTGEIFFTSGGTEADNMAITCAVRDLGVERIITLPTEHHAVLHTVDFLEKFNGVEVVYLPVNSLGEFSLVELNDILSNQSKKTLVSIMHGNNEVGNLSDLKGLSDVVKANGALLHSDTVQTVGHYSLDLSEIPIDFIACSAHKIHGPKGVGFAFIRGGLKIHPLIHGGGQERNLRSGTENIIGIAGLGAAITEAYSNLEDDTNYLRMLKSYAIERLNETFPGLSYNGKSNILDQSLNTVLSLSLPAGPKTDMLLFSLDIAGIAISGGSACNSGAAKGSHVIDSLRAGQRTTQNVRISFSKYNTKEEVDTFVSTLKNLLDGVDYKL